MELIISINSYIVSGVSMVFFNFILFAIIKFLCQSICSSDNIHRIYDKRQSLAPQSSNFSRFFGGPVGNLVLARVFALVIIFYSLIVILIDFSINGGSRSDFETVTYASVVQGSPKNKPLDIDYENELKVENGIHRVSTRLVAISEANACQNLNFSHHRMKGYAFKDVTLGTDLRLTNNTVQEAVCVTSAAFESSRTSFSIPQTAYPAFDCRLTSDPLETVFETNSVVGTVRTPLPNCSIDISDVGCFKEKESNTDYCAAVGNVFENNKNHTMVIFVRNASSPKEPEIHELRNMTIDPMFKQQLATNVAFLTAVDFKQSAFTTMYMALHEVQYDVDLRHRKSVNFSEIDLSCVIPVVTIVLIILIVLLVYALVSWYKYVYAKNRTAYNSFSTVDEMLEMVQDGGFCKRRGKLCTGNIALSSDGKPYFSANTVSDNY